MPSWLHWIWQQWLQNRQAAVSATSDLLAVLSAMVLDASYFNLAVSTTLESAAVAAVSDSDSAVIVENHTTINCEKDANQSKHVIDGRRIMGEPRHLAANYCVE